MALIEFFSRWIYWNFSGKPTQNNFDCGSVAFVSSANDYINTRRIMLSIGWNNQNDEWLCREHKTSCNKENSCGWSWCWRPSSAFCAFAALERERTNEAILISGSPWFLQLWFINLSKAPKLLKKINWKLLESRDENCQQSRRRLQVLTPIITWLNSEPQNTSNLLLCSLTKDKLNCCVIIAVIVSALKPTSVELHGKQVSKRGKISALSCFAIMISYLL